MPDAVNVIAPSLLYPEGSVRALRHARQDPLGFLRRLASCGDIVPFSLGKERAFLLNCPAHIESVLVSHADAFDKGHAFQRAKQLLGNGLLTAEGDLHLRRRRLMQPAFRREQIDGYGDAMAAHAARLRDQWQEGQAIDVASEMGRLTLTIVGRTLFGTNLEAESVEVRKALATGIACLDPLVSLVAPVRRIRPARQALQAVIDRLIDRRAGTDDDADDLLSLLIRAHAAEAGTIEQLRDDALTMLAAGHDTISNALTWTWMLLARHPDVEERLYREVRAVVGHRLPAAADLGRLTYARSVLAESLRLFPPAWVMARRAIAPHRVEGEVIPTGSLVIMSQYLMHRDPRFFEEPLAFEPDRWASDRQSSRPRFAYFPFGAGPRSCIGEGFAWMEGVLLLATIAQRWTLSSAGGGEIDMDPRITLRPKGAVMMTVNAHPMPSA